MNVLDTVRAERPDVARLDPATRAALRERVVGTATCALRDGAQGAEREVQPSAPVAPAARGSWLTVAAILIVGLGLAAVIVTAGRPWSMPPAAPPSTTADRGPLYPSATVPVIESMPDPLVIGAVDPLSTAEPAPTTAAPELSEPDDAPDPTGTPFTLLAVAEPPAGYELASAVFDPGPAPLGIARYVTMASGTQLWLTLGSDFEPLARLDQLGRTSWTVDGAVVWDAGEGAGGCLHDVCSVAWAWDPSTVVTLQWVEPDGGRIDAGATQAALLDLVPSLRDRPEIWSVGDPATGWSTSDAGLRPSARLLLPGEGQEVEAVGALVAGPGGTSASALLAPDGSMVIARLLPNAAGEASDTPPSADVRPFGEIDLVADAAGTVTTYESVEKCWMLRLFDGGSIGANASWRDPLVELAGTIDVDDGGVVIGPPSGWTNLGTSGSAALHDVTIRVPGAAGPAFVQVTQGPGSAAAFTNALAPRLLQVVSFLGGDALIGVTSIDPVVTTVMWQRAGTSYVATSEQLDVDGIEAVVADMQQGFVADWNDRFGSVQPSGDELSAGAGCAMPTLSISGLGAPS